MGEEMSSAQRRIVKMAMSYFADIAHLVGIEPMFKAEGSMRVRVALCLDSMGHNFACSSAIPCGLDSGEILGDFADLLSALDESHLVVTGVPLPVFRDIAEDDDEFDCETLDGHAHIESEDDEYLDLDDETAIAIEPVHSALEEYQRLSGCETLDTISELLADLMFLADVSDGSFDCELRLARDIYRKRQDEQCEGVAP